MVRRAAPEAFSIYNEIQTFSLARGGEEFETRLRSRVDAGGRYTTSDAFRESGLIFIDRDKPMTTTLLSCARDRAYALEVGVRRTCQLSRSPQPRRRRCYDRFIVVNIIVFIVFVITHG